MCPKIHGNNKAIVTSSDNQPLVCTSEIMESKKKEREKREVCHLSSHTRLIQVLPGHPLAHKKMEQCASTQRRTSLGVNRDMNKDQVMGAQGER